MADNNDRPIHVYDVPPRIAQECGIKRVGLVQLTAREQQDAFARGRSDAFKQAMENVMSSWRLADDAKLSIADGSVEQAMSKASPALRQLIVAAFGQLHNPVEDEADAFLGSRKVQLG